MKHLLLFCVLLVLSGVEGQSDIHGAFDILTKIFRQILKSQPDDYKIGDGVHLLSKRSENVGRANTDDGTVLGVLENYLETHEVRIKLGELMPGEGFGRSLKSAMTEIYGAGNESKLIKILIQLNAIK